MNVLLDVAHQSLHLRRPDEALRLVGSGLAVESSSPDAVSEATRSYLSSVQSWSYAMLGDTTGCERAMDRAEQHFAAVDPGTARHPGRLRRLVTAPRDSGVLPGHRELDAVCGALGLDPAGARMLMSRSNAVYHLPAEAAVLRLSSATPTNEARAALVVSLTSWIADHGGPALAPTPHPQPVWEAGTVATLWPYLPSPGVPRARDLARAVRELHHLDAPHGSSTPTTQPRPPSDVG